MTKKDKKTVLVLALAAGGVFAYWQYKKAQNISFKPLSISNFKLSILNNEASFTAGLEILNTTDIKIDLLDLIGSVYINNVYISNYQLLQNMQIPAGSAQPLSIAFVLPLSALFTAGGSIVEALQAGESIEVKIVYNAKTNYGNIESYYTQMI